MDDFVSLLTPSYAKSYDNLVKSNSCPMVFSTEKVQTSLQIIFGWYLISGGGVVGYACYAK